LFISKIIIIKGDEDTIVQLICIYKVLAKTNYYDMLIVDDTVGVGSNNYPIEVVVLKDPYGRIQLLGFGTIDSKKSNSFTDFFRIFKELVEIERKEANITEYGKIIVFFYRLKA